jgi:hypothetical protein
LTSKSVSITDKSVDITDTEIDKPVLIQIIEKSLKIRKNKKTREKSKRFSQESFLNLHHLVG